MYRSMRLNYENARLLLRSRSRRRDFSKFNKKVFEVVIDRSGLFNLEDDRLGSSDNSTHVSKEVITPLTKDMMTHIQLKGPISFHEFMTQASNNKAHGYYQNQDDKIGKSGDFVTSPEISQLFGEVIAIWCVSCWEQLGRPSKIGLTELGPGNGTLMADILRSVKKFSAFKSALSVHMVEISESLQTKQKELLNVSNTVVQDHDVLGVENELIQGRTNDGVSVTWHRFLRTVPKLPTLFVAQEFLDAFPIHQFRKISNDVDGWREVLVDVQASPTSPLHFRLVLAPKATPASRMLMSEAFSKRLGKSESMTDSVKAAELSPLALAVTAELSHRIAAYGGAGLIIDYGEDFPQADTVRGFKGHSQVHPLSLPGQADITADVDFSAVAEVAREAGALASQTVTQGEFLVHAGMVQRVEALLALDSVTDEQGETLVQAVHTLAGSGPGEMGSRYKVLAIIHPDLRSATLPGLPAFDKCSQTS